MAQKFYQDQPRLVICGSMSFHGDMLEIRDRLQRAGVPCLVPKADDRVKAQYSPEEFEAFKRSVSHEYLKEIRHRKTFGILAVNKDKHNIPSYIGPNTFGEIAVAFENGKDIYLYYGIPPVYEEELIAWEAKPLKGHLDLIVETYKIRGYFASQPPLFANFDL